MVARAISSRHSDERWAASESAKRIYGRLFCCYLYQIRLANICVDMSLPMHFHKFMVAIKQIVTILVFYFIFCLLLLFARLISVCSLCVRIHTLSEHVSRALTHEMNCDLCHMVIYHSDKNARLLVFFSFLMLSLNVLEHLNWNKHLTAVNIKHFPVIWAMTFGTAK